MQTHRSFASVLPGVQLVAALVLPLASVAAQAQLALPFNSNNGLVASAASFFNLTVTNPSGITIVGLDVNTQSPVGTIGAVELWTTPTTYAGQQLQPASWTLRATGECRANGQNVPSPVCLGAGVFLMPGTHGVYVRHVGLGLRYTNSAGSVTVGNADVAYTGGDAAIANTPFGGAPNWDRIWNGVLRYNVGAVSGPACLPLANKTTYGSGCYGPFGDSWYEAFAGLATCDLAGAVGNETVLVATPNGSQGYTVTSAAPAWFAPLGVPLLGNTTPPSAMTDDTMSQGLSLPFVFAFPGGSVTTVHANANGYVHLGATTSISGDYTPTVAEMHTLQPRLFPLWGDWQVALNAAVVQPSGVFFDVDPSGQAVYVTWLGVADRRGQTPAPGSTSLSFQVVLRSNGVFEFRYRGLVPAANGAGAVLVGYSKGNRNVANGPVSVDSGSRDLTATVPFLANGPDQLPLLLDGNAPQLGTVWQLQAQNLEAVSPVGLLVFGTTSLPAGLDLGFLGAPGCRAYQSGDVTSALFASVGGGFAATLPIPSSVAFAGLPVYCQALGLTTRNALALATSNGLSAVLGL